MAATHFPNAFSATSQPSGDFLLRQNRSNPAAKLQRSCGKTMAKPQQCRGFFSQSLRQSGQRKKQFALFFEEPIIR